MFGPCCRGINGMLDNWNQSCGFDLHMGITIEQFRCTAIDVFFIHTIAATQYRFQTLPISHRTLSPLHTC